MIDRSPFAPDADDDPGPARARRLAARAEALRALMHDLKATQTSMLSLLELRRLRAAAVDEARLAEAIDTGARRALRLVRDLECFAFAATDEYRQSRVDLDELLESVVAAARASALARDVALVREPSPPEAFADVWRDLLARAFGQMIDVALAEARPGASVRCGLRADPAGWQVDVAVAAPPGRPADGGVPGLPEGFEDTRAPARDLPPWHERPALSLADLVADRHGGELSSSTDQGGIRLRLRLPRPGLAQGPPPSPHGGPATG